MKLFRIIILLLMIFAVTLSSGYHFVYADDDREEESDDDDDEDEDEESIAPSKTTTSIKYVNQTVILEPAKIVTSIIMKNVPLLDSDRDGIPDEQDLYPNIPEQIIVVDSNLNGINDNYELQEIQQ